MLILYKVKQLARICLSDKFERTNLKACRKFADNIFGFVLSKCFFEELFSICNTAFCNVLLCKTYFVEFRKYFFLGLRRYASCIGNFKCKLFYSSRKCLNILADFSGPRAISRIALFWTPSSPLLDFAM